MPHLLYLALAHYWKKKEDKKTRSNEKNSSWSMIGVGQGGAQKDGVMERKRRHHGSGFSKTLPQQ
jgi:hypothetical protein